MGIGIDEALTLALALIIGLLLGGIFFGGLWWTVKKAVFAKHPAPWFLVSLLLRVSLVCTGIYFTSAGQWQRLCACLFGLLMARFMVIALTRETIGATSLIAGDSHAP